MKSLTLNPQFCVSNIKSSFLLLSNPDQKTCEEPKKKVLILSRTVLRKSLVV